MKASSRYTLQRTMIIYFLLICFASMLVGVEFIIDTYTGDLETRLLDDFGKYSQGEITETELFHPINRLRAKAILMIAVILFVMIIVLTMFIKNITEPLQHMIETSKKIARGDLSKTINIRADNELAELGAVINETTSNLQEIIMLAKNMVQSGDEFMDKTRDILGEGDITPEHAEVLRQEIRHLQNEFEMLAEVIDYFNFYTVES